MGPKEQYAEKLRDPRWQRKRLAIFERDKWRCAVCDRDDTTLHVHHLKYTDDPWDTPDDLLETLCEHCHQAREATNQLLARLLHQASSVEIAELAKHIDLAGRLARHFKDVHQYRGSYTTVTVTCLSTAAEHYWNSLRPPEKAVQPAAGNSL